MKLLGEVCKTAVNMRVRRRRRPKSSGPQKQILGWEVDTENRGQHLFSEAPLFHCGVRSSFYPASKNRAEPLRCHSNRVQKNHTSHGDGQDPTTLPIQIMSDQLKRNKTCFFLEDVHQSRWILHPPSWPVDDVYDIYVCSRDHFLCQGPRGLEFRPGNWFQILRTSKLVGVSLLCLLDQLGLI